ncbi:hypothetical protein H0H93_001908 [Arthromyces matolae]|nr:hypothetical protein H0H93_001908 [Arthromyces matolae]
MVDPPSSNRSPSTSNNLHAALAAASSSTNNLDAEVGNLKVHLANLIWRDRYGTDNHPPPEGKEYNEAMKSVMDEVMRLTTDVVFQKHQRAEGMMMSESEKLKAQRIALGKIIDETTKVRSLKEDIVNLLWHNRYGARGQRQPKGKKYEEAMRDMMEEVSRLTLNAIYQKHRETEVVTMLAFERLEAERFALKEIRDK